MSGISVILRLRGLVATHSDHHNTSQNTSRTG